jgi:hypothetical protein
MLVVVSVRTRKLRSLSIVDSIQRTLCPMTSRWRIIVVGRMLGNVLRRMILVVKVKILSGGSGGRVNMRISVAVRMIRRLRVMVIMFVLQIWLCGEECDVEALEDACLTLLYGGGCFLRISRPDGVVLHRLAFITTRLPAGLPPGVVLPPVLSTASLPVWPLTLNVVIGCAMVTAVVVTTLRLLGQGYV